MIRDGYPMRFTPRGLSDAFDMTDTFPGACRLLTNLIFDQANPEIVIPRPGVGNPTTAFLNYLNLDGSAGAYATSPNAAPIQIAGDIDIIAYVALNSWLPATANVICSKWLDAGNEKSYLFYISLSGAISLLTSNNGSSVNGGGSSVATGFAANQGAWIRATLKVNNGAGGNDTTFYTSTNSLFTAPANIVWTKLGTTLTSAGTASIFNSTTELEIGSYDAGLSLLSGKIYKVFIYSGIGGTLKASFSSNDAAPGAATVVSSLTGETYTLHGTAAIVAQSGSGAGFANPGFISVHIGLGTRVYGMVATSRNPGNDEPFCYDTATSAFVPISGVTSGNTPTSPATTGPWTPPTMAVIGTKIIVTHPGFNGIGSNFFGVIDITTPATPAWSDTNTGGHPLPSVPLWVANFNNRAYYGCGNQTFYSDVLVPTNMTNAGQALTIGDTTNLLASSGLPVQTSTAGVVQTLTVFKENSLWQITGDAAVTGSLAFNFISLTIGCSAPRTIQTTPLGIIFMGVDGIYNLDQLGVLHPLVHSGRETDNDVQIPFQYATTPSRAASGFVGNMYRISLDTIIQGVSQTNDYWFEMHRRGWTGPHSFNYDCCSQVGANNILTYKGVPGMLFTSQVQPTTSTAYLDNGNTFICTVQSSAFPKEKPMSQKQVIESTQELNAAGGSINYNITAMDDQGNTLNSTAISSLPSGANWGTNLWGGGTLWSSGNQPAHVYDVPWTLPLIFQKVSLQIQATAAAQVQIGTHFSRWKDCGYMNRNQNVS